MRYLVLGAIYSLFFLSGSAALVYQVAWVRSLSLVFGGSHLAVTVVLSVFMGGLAIGGYVIGRYVDRVTKPLRLYGMLELGIACFAVLFIALMKIYPWVYIFLAQGRDDSPLYLSMVRLLFSVVALILPTSLMGGTLPVLSKFISDQPRNLRTRLSFLYGFNTLGAALGAIAAGFFLLRFYSVSTALYSAILTNVIIGLAAIGLQNKAAAVLAPSVRSLENGEPSPQWLSPDPVVNNEVSRLPFLLVAWGIAISGFCALGYEVLWTRILALVLGASVYSFTTMLVAFLVGIGLGSGAYALWGKILRQQEGSIYTSISGFGIVQIIIGATALLASLYLRDLPAHVTQLYGLLQAKGVSHFGARLWSSFLLAFAYMLVPAFFMGVAFPMAGKIHAQCKKAVGAAVGDVLAYNTCGAILGAAASGLLFVYAFGIERSLQMLTVINIGFGLFVLCSVRPGWRLHWAIPPLGMAALLFFALNHESLRMWDPKYFAIFRSNQLEVFNTPEKVRDALENTDVLYYAEGAESIVSSIKVKGGEQAFITNGRVEASSHAQGQQMMFALSHLPMLIHKNPKRALVVGLGSGMTLGAISVHPGLEELVLAEIEPKVLGVARTFEKYNHKVLDNPRVNIVFNDGRNFLLTTRKKFDVITADPIHPWFRGASYLYTSEYFKLASDHLLPGGIVCQWLPIYELTPEDVQSVMKTFGQHFAHTMLFLTHYDAELIGSNSPIVIDETILQRRIVSEPAIADDLKRVTMGSADDLLSYFLMGTQGMSEFAKDGIVNTDNNLYLEFSAPLSIGRSQVMEKDVLALLEHGENILPYLAAPTDERAREEQKKKWMARQEAQRLVGRALALLLGGKSASGDFKKLMAKLDQEYPGFAPARFLRAEQGAEVNTTPVLIQKVALHLLTRDGKAIVKEISAVAVGVSAERSAAIFVDNDERVIYGQLYVSGPRKNEFIKHFVNDVITEIEAAYQEAATPAMRKQRTFPYADGTLNTVREIILRKIKENEKNADT